MKILELFCGTKSFSKVAEKRGHKCFTIDINPDFKPTWCFDILKLTDDTICALLEEYDVIWMSPPCTTFSMASGNTHWTAQRQPKTENAEIGLKLLEICKDIAERCIEQGKLFIIENPRARARWFLPKEWRDTAWYCQYGDKRAKPTDFWHNIPNLKLRQCKNGNPDHEPAPRGSKTGTQGMKQVDRYRIPEQLCEEILKAIENDKKKRLSSKIIL